MDNNLKMDDEIREYPLDGILDLHMFQPSEARSAVIEYLSECRREGILHVRIIHGKGSGVLKNTVRSLLDKCDFVKMYGSAPDSSGWGATLVDLFPEDN